MNWKFWWKLDHCRRDRIETCVFRYTRKFVKVIRETCYDKRLHELKCDSNIPPFGRCKFKYLNSIAKFKILGEHDLEEVMQTYLQSGANFKIYLYKIRIVFNISVLISIIGESGSSELWNNLNCELNKSPNTKIQYKICTKEAIIFHNFLNFQFDILTINA